MGRTPERRRGCGTGCGCPGRRTLRSGIGGCRASSSGVGGTSGATNGATIDDAIAETIGGTIGWGEIGGSVAGVSEYIAFWSMTTLAGAPARRPLPLLGRDRVERAGDAIGTAPGEGRRSGTIRGVRARWPERADLGRGFAGGRRHRVQAERGALIDALERGHQRAGEGVDVGVAIARVGRQRAVSTARTERGTGTSSRERGLISPSI